MSAHEPCPACGRCRTCGHGHDLPVWVYPWWTNLPQPPPQLERTVQYAAPIEYLACTKETA